MTRRAHGGMGGRPRRAPGFTLVELLVVLVVIGLLLGLVISPLATQVQIREIREAEAALSGVRDALIGYAQANGELPCPDTDVPPDGQENFTPGPPDVCVSLAGTLPWRDLGVEPADRWGRVYGYRVTGQFTNPAVPGALADPTRPDLADNGTITVNGDRDNGKDQVTITTTAAAVVVSTGANGHCGRRVDGSWLAAPDDGARWNCPPAPAPYNPVVTGAGAVDEQENVDGDAVFVSRIRTEGGDTCDDAAASAGPLCAYDDQLAWIPTTILLGKLVEAGQLP